MEVNGMYTYHQNKNYLDIDELFLTGTCMFV